MEPLTLAAYIAGPIILAAFGKWLLWSFHKSIEQQVKPLADKLVEHMDNEETHSARISVQLERIADQFQANEREHAELRARLDRVEKHK